jgi:hypothetical protein
MRGRGAVLTDDITTGDARACPNRFEPTNATAIGPVRRFTAMIEPQLAEEGRHER